MPTATNTVNRNRDVRKQSARVISDLLNPLTLPVVVLITINYAAGTDLYHQFSVAGISILMFGIIPLLAALSVSKMTGYQARDITDQKWRNVIYISSLLGIWMGTEYVFADYFLGPLYNIVMAYFLTLGVAFLINLKWKISAHCGALAASVAILLWLQESVFASNVSLMLLLLFFVMLPVLAWSRIRLGVHSLTEAIAGICIGAIISSGWLFL